MSVRGFNTGAGVERYDYNALDNIPATTNTKVKGDAETEYRQGNVNLTKANIGLGNVDNTSDANKPVSTAQQTALNGKVDKVTGKGLSTNDYTDADKQKVADAALQADLDGLSRQIGDAEESINAIAEVSSVNIFNGEFPTIGLVTTTGSINPNTSYQTSDFIPIDSSNATLYFLRATSPYVVYLCFYTDTNESSFIGSRITVFTTSTTALRQAPTIQANAKYIRISKPVNPTDTLCLSYTLQPEYVPYSPVAKIKDSALDVNNKISEWYSRNFNEKENIIKNASYALSGTVGFEVYDNVKGNPVAYKMISSNGTSADIRFTLPETINLIGVQAFDIEMYIENVGNITSVQLSTFTPSATTFSRGISASSLSNGWNYVRINTAQQETLTAQTWSTASVFRVVTQGTGAFTITISAINVERMGKAKLIFVDDHGYHGFKELAYPLLKAAGQPVTWALNPGRLGVAIGTQESILTQADIDELAYDAFSEFSFHNWNPSGNQTETMTPDELRQDFHKCITYLREHGICPTHLWRAAYTQNKANNWWVAQDIVEATACHDDGGGFETWPFTQPYNVHRYGIHKRESSQIDDFFERLRLTHTTVVLYTHGCVETRSESDDLHCTVAEVEYLCSKIAAGVSGGWLEPTTYSRLATMKEHGMYTLTDT